MVLGNDSEQDHPDKVISALERQIRNDTWLLVDVKCGYDAIQCGLQDWLDWRIGYRKDHKDNRKSGCLSCVGQYEFQDLQRVENHCILDKDI